jgi:hypothetical protein
VPVVHPRRRGIAGGEHITDAADPQVIVNRQAAQPITRNSELGRQAAGPHSGAPHHGGGRDHLAAVEGDRFGVDGGHRRGGAHLDAAVRQRRLDHRPGVRAHVGADLRVAVNQHGVGGAPQPRGQPAGEFAGGLDPGQSGTDHHHGVARRARCPVGQRGQMRVEAHRRVIGVDVESELGQPGDVGLDDVAAGRDHQTVVVDNDIAGGHGVRGDVDTGDGGGDVADTHRIQQARQRNPAIAEVGLVVAHPDVVKRLRTQDGDLHRGRRSQFIEPPCRAEGGPQTREARADDEYLSHGVKLVHRTTDACLTVALHSRRAGVVRCAGSAAAADA